MLQRRAPHQDLTIDDVLPAWQPSEFGYLWATAIAMVLVVLLLWLIAWNASLFTRVPQHQALQVMQVHMVALPRPVPPRPQPVPRPPPPPPPPPQVVQPPKPVPVPIPKPAPVPSTVVVPAHRPRPVPHHAQHPKPVIERPVPKPVPPPPPPAASRPPAPSMSWLAGYGAHMHDIIENNVQVPAALRALGASGTVVITVVVAPDGHPVRASVARSSGNPLIDRCGREAVLASSYGRFAASGIGPLTFTVPIEINANVSD